MLNKVERLGFMKKNQGGFSALHIVLVLVVVGIIGFAGWKVWDSSKKEEPKKETTTNTTTKTDEKKEEAISQQESLKIYTIENEGLTFQYNPKITTVTAEKPKQENDLYLEDLDVKTGSVTLSIRAGIDGIGGSPQCIVGDRSKCEVIATKNSTFLGKTATYRLVKSVGSRDCGYEGVPSCDNAPLTTSFFLDTYSGTDEYGPCCGTISTKSKNTGKKAKVTGSLLLSIKPKDTIANKDLLLNKDILETIRIIESMHY